MPALRPSPGDVARKTLTRARARGLAEVASEGWSRAREAVSSEGSLIVFARPAGGEPVSLPGLELRAATAADAARYARDVGTEAESTFRARLHGSTRCYLVLEGDTVLHATWVTGRAAWTREIGAYLVPPPKHVYVYESFTATRARGRGIYRFALTGIAEEAGAQGIEMLWVAVEHDNLPSLRAVVKAGFTAALTIAYRRRLGVLSLARPALLDDAGPSPSLCVARSLDACNGGAAERSGQ